MDNREIEERAGDLRRPIEPPHDLWPEVARRIESGEVESERESERGRPVRSGAPPRRARRRRWILLTAGIAAAALLLIFLRYGMPAVVRPPGGIEGSAPTASTSLPLLAGAFDGAARASLEGDRELLRLSRRITEGPRRVVMTGVVPGLSQIDDAIAEVREAWSAEPRDPRLARRMANLFERRADLQRIMLRAAA